MRLLYVMLVSVLLASFTTTAWADPGKDESGHGRDESHDRHDAWKRALEHRREAAKERREYEREAAKARRLLNWSPLFDLDKGLTRTIAWYRRFLEDGVRA